MHKFVMANPGEYGRGGEIRNLNDLVYRLVGEGENISAFAIPTDDTINNERLATLLEGLLMYLKDTKD